MEDVVRTHVDNLRMGNRELEGVAFNYLMNTTENQVDWAYDVWEEMIENLSHQSNRVRAIASQVLCNIAKSDPDGRILDHFESLLAVTRDERFVTARHCLQSLWKVGIAGDRHRRVVLDGLERRYYECVSEKNTTLIRYDILESMRKIYDVSKDEAIRMNASELIAKEDDEKYRKKYARLWKL